MVVIKPAGRNPKATLSGPRKPVVFGSSIALKGKARGATSAELRQGARILETARPSKKTGFYRFVLASDRVGPGPVSVYVKAVYSDGPASLSAPLRLMVVGGGCSGFSYKIGFDESIKEDDRAEEIKGVKVIVDEKSTLYLDGVEIDFHDGLMGKGFVFNNPNASGTCGCGESFSV